MTNIEELHLIVNLIKKHHLPLSPFFLNSIKNREEDYKLMEFASTQQPLVETKKAAIEKDKHSSITMSTSYCIVIRKNGDIERLPLGKIPKASARCVFYKTKVIGLKRDIYVESASSTSKDELQKLAKLFLLEHGTEEEKFAIKNPGAGDIKTVAKVQDITSSSGSSLNIDNGVKHSAWEIKGHKGKLLMGIGYCDECKSKVSSLWYYSALNDLKICSKCRDKYAPNGNLPFKAIIRTNMGGKR